MEKWLKFTEENDWEGETWTMLVRAVDSGDLELVEMFIAAWNSDTWNQPYEYAFEIIEATNEEVEAAEANAVEGYYNSFDYMDMSDRLREKLLQMFDIIKRGEANDTDWNDYLYKMRLFFE